MLCERWHFPCIVINLAEDEGGVRFVGWGRAVAMSVLYKALAKAAKAREALQPEPDPYAKPRLVGRGAGRSRLRLALLAVAGSLALGVGALVFFGDDILSALDQVQEAASNGPPLPGPIGVRPPQRPVKPPVSPRVQVARPAQPAPEAPSVAVALPAPPPPAPPQQVAAAPVPPGVPAAPLPPTAAEPANPPVAPVPVEAPPAAPPPTALPAAPSPGAAAPWPPAPPPPVPPRQSAKAAPPPAEEDLPAIMDRIRREKAKPAIAQAVKVDRRTATADLTGADGESAVTVSVTMPTEHEDAKTAYDMLLHGQYDGALSLYDKALKSSPGSVPLLLGKATAEHKLRRFHAARETYARVLAVDPDNREALTNMTAIVAAQAPQQALDELRSLQRSYPSFSPIAAQIAAIEAQRNEVGAAIAALNEAITLSPENGLYRLNLAILQDRAGMRAEAVASYQTAIDLLGPATSLPVPLEQIRQRLKYLQGR